MGCEIYVASSWRNEYQPAVVEVLRACGWSVYDFRNPGEGLHGFAWSEVDPLWQEWTVDRFRECLNHEVSNRGFYSDFDALRDCRLIVLVLPCGRSAHLELGHAIGRGARSIIYYPPGIQQQEPELMYKMADCICASLPELISSARQHMSADSFTVRALRGGAR